MKSRDFSYDAFMIGLCVILCLEVHYNGCISLFATQTAQVAWPMFFKLGQAGNLSNLGGNKEVQAQYVINHEV